MAHRCPPRCHFCPLLDGDIMPGCMGTAALARGPRDKSYCTCRVEAEQRNRDIEHMGETIRYLVKQVRELEKQLNIRRISE